MRKRPPDVSLERKKKGRLAEEMQALRLRSWRMPPLNRLAPLNMTLMTKVWMGVLRGYLLIAVALIAFKIVQAATGAAVEIPQLGGAQTGSQVHATPSGSGAP